jgi:UDP-glucose 4-epimerase
MLTHGWPKPAMPARVVVIGAAGFVGGALVHQLRLRDIPVLVVTRGAVDLLAPDADEKLAAEFRPDDAVVAAAAIAPVKTSEMLKDNITLVQAVANALRKRPVAHVLNIGSDAIYGDSSRPLSEESPTAPMSLHGIMHLAREVILGEAVGDRPFASLRPTLIYGAADPHNGYGPNRFRRLAADGKDIVLFGNGEEQRDHVFIDDVVELAAQILVHRSSGALNAATGTVITFRQAAELVAACYRNRVLIQASTRTGPMPHNGYRAFDPSATLAAFEDFRYMPPTEGLAQMCETGTRRA